uniref:Rho GTPase activating protein 10 n=1 Tax=Esox lucius TaxID=8010 RepID=A0A6Q2Y3W4_ESOLU
MGLHPLEFSECYLDSPGFREKIKAHEAELDKTNRFIKELYKDGKNLINATKQLGLAQRKFAHSLGEFQFEYIGDAKTDDEKCIGECDVFTTCSLLLPLNITETLMKPLEKFRKEQLGTAKAERKKFEKETEKYYSSLEKLLNMSAKKKEPQLQEADIQVETIRQHFQEESLDYVCKLQEIQERKKFDCVEPMLAFFQTVFTFYHQGFELAKDFDHYKKALQINIQNTRSRFEGTRVEVFELMKRIREVPQEYRQTSPISSEGYLYVQEKRPPPFGSSWVKRYCTFVKEQKILHMVTFDHRSGGKIGETESVTLKSCVRKSTDALDRRFCLDIEITDRYVVMSTPRHNLHPGILVPETFHDRPFIDAQLDDVGLAFVKNAISAIEIRGINDQGLYRVVGVSSKVQKLLSLMIDEKSNDVDLCASEEWDVKTVTKNGAFLSCFKTEGGSPESRSKAIHCLVHKLPESNRLVLGLLMKHLATVAAHSKKNLMTVANLGVVFGPTLMRPQEDTVAAIMDLKFQNIVVEILIEQHETVTRPPASLKNPAPRLFLTGSSVFKALNTKALVRAPSHYIPVCLSLRLPLICLSFNLHPSLSLPSSTRPSVSPPPPVPQSPLLHPSLSLPSSTRPSVSPPPPVPQSPLLHPSLSLPSSTRPSVSPPPPVPHVTGGSGRRAKAVYPCEAEYDSELSFQVGAIFSAVAPSREPGWLEGELEGKRGLIPENYVEML